MTLAQQVTLYQRNIPPHRTAYNAAARHLLNRCGPCGEYLARLRAGHNVGAVRLGAAPFMVNGKAVFPNARDTRLPAHHADARRSTGRRQAQRGEKEKPHEDPI